MTFIHEYDDYPGQKNVDNGIWEFDGTFCYNRNGGHHIYTPHPMDKKFEAESWDEVLKAELLANRYKYTTGWISPNGAFFGCDVEDHDDMARYVLGQSQTTLERSGWIKVYENPARVRAMAHHNMKRYDYYCEKIPTQEQEEVLTRLGIEI